MKKYFLKFRNLLAILLVITTISSVVSAPITWRNTDPTAITYCTDEPGWLVETR